MKKIVFALLMLSFMQSANCEEVMPSTEVGKAIDKLMKVYGASCADESTKVLIERIMSGASADVGEYNLGSRVFQTSKLKIPACKIGFDKECILSLDKAIGARLQNLLKSQKCNLPNSWSLKILELACKKKKGNPEVNIQNSKVCPIDLSDCEDSSLASTTIPLTKNSFRLNCNVPEGGCYLKEFTSLDCELSSNHPLRVKGVINETNVNVNESSLGADGN